MLNALKGEGVGGSITLGHRVQGIEVLGRVWEGFTNYLKWHYIKDGWTSILCSAMFEKSMVQFVILSYFVGTTSVNRLMFDRNSFDSATFHLIKRSRIYISSATFNQFGMSRSRKKLIVELASYCQELIACQETHPSLLNIPPAHRFTPSEAAKVK